MAIAVGLIHLGFTVAILWSFIYPDKSTFKLENIPSIWRFILLFVASVLAGIIIQVAGVSYRLH